MKRFAITCLLLFSLSLCFAQPRFKGGNEALNTFLSNNLVYPEYSLQNCISGSVKVSFTVDRAGKVHNVKVYAGMGTDLDDEAMRVIGLTSGKWIVGNDDDTRINLIIPINFSADATRCRGTSGTDVAQAIEEYKEWQTSVDVVTSYYAAKHLGKADTKKEAAIIALKDELGLDDDFTDKILEQGNKKLKQGDNEGACKDWLFIRNLGSDKADNMLAHYCH